MSGSNFELEQIGDGAGQADDTELKEVLATQPTPPAPPPPHGAVGLFATANGGPLTPWGLFAPNGGKNLIRLQCQVTWAPGGHSHVCRAVP